MSFENPLQKQPPHKKATNTRDLVRTFYGSTGLAVLRKIRGSTASQETRKTGFDFSDREIKMKEMLEYRSRLFDTPERTAKLLQSNNQRWENQLKTEAMLFLARKNAGLPTAELRDALDEHIALCEKKMENPEQMAKIYLLLGERKQAEDLIQDLDLSYQEIDKANILTLLLRDDAAHNIHPDQKVEEVYKIFSHLLTDQKNAPDVDDVCSFIELAAKSSVDVTDLLELMDRSVRNRRYPKGYSLLEVEEERSRQYLAIARAAVDLDQLDRAKVFAQNMKEISDRVSYAVALMKRFLQRGDTQRAEELFIQTLPLACESSAHDCVEEIIKVGTALPNPLDHLSRFRQQMDQTDEEGLLDLDPMEVDQLLIPAYLTLGRSDLAAQCLHNMERTTEERRAAFSQKPSNRDLIYAHIYLAKAYQTLGKDPEPLLRELHRKMLLPDGNLHPAFQQEYSYIHWPRIIDTEIEFGIDPTPLLEAMKRSLPQIQHKSTRNTALMRIFKQEIAWATKQAEIILSQTDLAYVF